MPAALAAVLLISCGEPSPPLTLGHGTGPLIASPTVRSSAIAVVLVLAVLTGWVSPRVVSYLCSMGDGTARRECCCGPDEEAARLAGGPAIERASCCEVRSESAVVSLAVAPELDRVVIDSATPSSAFFRDDEVVRGLRTPQATPRGPPRGVGPPPWLLHRALLI